MPVTEFALLPLNSSAITPSLTTKLQTSLSVLQTASTYPFHVYRQLENPSLLYLLGSWTSVSAHYAFLPSPENAALLETLKDDVVIGVQGEEEDEGKGIRMFHLECDLFGQAKDGKRGVLEAPVVAVTRSFVKSNNREAFDKRFEGVKVLLEELSGEYAFMGGWRIEKQKVSDDEKGGEGEREEWVMFSGWKSLEEHNKLAHPKVGDKFKAVLEWVEGIEVRHFKAVEL